VSEVFAVHELLALHRAGMLAGIWATKPGETGARQPQSVELDPLVTVLPAGGVADQAAAMATQLAQRTPGVTGVHGYFAHDPAAVARRVAGLLGLPYSFSMHALDARKVASADLAEQARHAAAVICCNPDVSVHVDGAERRPSLVRHGVDLVRFTATDPLADPAASGPLELLAVGRLVAKKGFDVLLDAMSLVERPVRLTLVGTGPLLGDLQSQIADRHLGDRVELAGRRTHDTLPGEYARAQVVVVPSVVDTAGDRDGLPNVVLEAMASARPVIASDVAAVATAVDHGSTGLLVPPGDPRALAAAVDNLAANRLRRLAMGRAGRAVVESDFDLDACTAQFCRSLEKAHG
jgi:glycosyltransferase involved in cell wall biosynthesis